MTNAWVAAILGFLVLQYFYVSAQKVASIPYSQFEQLLHEHKVSEVGVSDRYLQGKLKEPLPNGKSEFVTTRVDPQFADELQKYDVTYTGEVGSTLLQDLLSWILPAALFLGVWMFLSRRITQGLGGGLMSIGKSKAKIYVESDTGVRFDDVAGVDEAKEELREIVEFLKNPEQYSRLGGRMPKGILLVGPPGTGKTLLAKAVAGQAKVPFFSIISGSEFVEMFVGVGAARVRDLFEQARTKAPAIIFIDELDALGRARGFGPYGGHDEKEQTLNQLLVEMDGFDARSGLVILAATNRPEILDPALLRAGRFDRQVLVDRPDKKGRVDILRVHLRKTKLANDVDAEKVAALTPGFTGADLTREELESKMAVLLGGRAAELTVFGHLSTGAADDLRRVTDIARATVTRYGMSERLGSVAYDRDPRNFMTGPELPLPQREQDYSPETAATIDNEVRDIVHAAMDRALTILSEKRDVLERSARKLLEKETLDEKDLAELIGPPPASPPMRVAAE